MWLWMLACAGDPGSEEGPRSAYATHAAPTLRTHCTACHGALRAEGGLRLDSANLASGAGEIALMRMQEGSMPPGGGVSAAEIQAFELWLAQGGPGEELPVPEGDSLGGGSLSMEVNVSVTELSVGRFELSFAEALSGAPLATEVWLLDQGRVSLEQRSTEAYTESWEPALVLHDPATESWTQDTQHSRSDDLGEDLWAERWTGQSWDTLDARAFDKQAIGSWITEEEGAEMGFQAGTLYFVARSRWEAELGLSQSQMVRTEALPDELLEHGMLWTERVILWP